MKLFWFVAGIATAGVGYAAWKYVKPPTLFLTTQAIDGTGGFVWGDAGGPIAPGAVQAGYGWSGLFMSFDPNRGWSFQLLKNSMVKGVYTLKLGPNNF